MVFAIITIVGIILIVGALVGIAIQGNPLLALIPLFDQNVEWLVSSFPILLPVGVFLTALGTSRNFIISAVVTVIVYVVFVIMGMIPSPLG